MTNIAFVPGPITCCNFILPPEAQAALLSEIYTLWTDCREDTAFGIVGCLAITRKRLPSGLGLARYQAMSTPRRAHYNRYTDQRVRVYDVTN
jgi:hypothetical protein